MRLPARTLMSFFFASAFACSLSVNVSAASLNYHVEDTRHLDGDVRWDYMAFDPGGRLFITHGDRVDVYDAAKKQVVASIDGVRGVHGVAFAPDLDRVFTSNGTDGTMSIFALSTLKLIATLPAEKKPDAIVYDSATKRVFVMNGNSGSITVVDAVNAKVVTSIEVGGKLEFAVLDGAGHLYVNVEDKNQLVVLDTVKMDVAARHNLAPTCDEPAGLSIDSANLRLFVGCHNQKMLSVDAGNGKILSTIAIGKGSDATAYDIGSARAFSSNGDGTLDIVEVAGNGSFGTRQSLKTALGARTLAVDQAAHKVYLVTAERETGENGKMRNKAGTFTLITVAP